MPEISSPFTMVVLIVLIAVTAGTIKNWLEIRAKHQGAGGEDVAAMRAEIDQLKERVRNLERLATDSDRRLDEEISQLA